MIIVQGGSLGFSSEICRLLQLCDEEDDATSALAAPKPDPDAQKVVGGYTSQEVNNLLYYIFGAVVLNALCVYPFSSWELCMASRNFSRSYHHVYSGTMFSCFVLIDIKCHLLIAQYIYVALGLCLALCFL